MPTTRRRKSRPPLPDSYAGIGLGERIRWLGHGPLIEGNTVPIPELAGLPVGKWLSAPEIWAAVGFGATTHSHAELRELLREAAGGGLLLTCKRRWLHHGGTATTLYRLTAVGQIAAYGRLVTAGDAGVVVAGTRMALWQSGPDGIQFASDSEA